MGCSVRVASSSVAFCGDVRCEYGHAAVVGNGGHGGSESHASHDDPEKSGDGDGKGHGHGDAYQGHCEEQWPRPWPWLGHSHPPSMPLV